MKETAKQVYDLLVVPTLQETMLYSPSAARLMVYTAACESEFQSLQQVLSSGNYGPAIGWWQMQENAFNQCVIYLNHKDNFTHKHNILMACEFFDELLVIPQYKTMLWHLRFALLMARVQYMQVPLALPAPDDLEGMGEYYVKYYNRGGKATLDRFMSICEGLLQ